MGATRLFARTRATPLFVQQVFLLAITVDTNRLDTNVRTLVDDAIAHIRGLLATGNYDQVIFSYDSEEKTLGTGIFKVANEVKTYIYQSICSLGDPQ